MDEQNKKETSSVNKRKGLRFMWRADMSLPPPMEVSQKKLTSVKPAYDLRIQMTTDGPNSKIWAHNGILTKYSPKL